MGSCNPREDYVMDTNFSGAEWEQGIGTASGKEQKRLWSIFWAGPALAGLYLTTLYSYLLFHTLIEMFSIVVASGIFMIAWNARRLLDNGYLLFVGVAYLFIGGVDLVHTMAYEGMNVFPGYDANLPTQLWIAARYLESLSLLAAPLFLARRINLRSVFIGFMLVTALLFFSIFSLDIFPQCYAAGKGLTPFKKISEYAISFILMAALGILHKRRDRFERHVFRFVAASIFLTIGAELAFTFYVSVYGFSNFVGHILKLASFYLIYKAIIETGFSQPIFLLFRSLKKSEEGLRREKEALEKALSDIKILRGLIPICSSCKKVRDDTGYWQQVDTYVRDHSEAEFTHSICPECAEKLYPDIYKRQG